MDVTRTASHRGAGQRALAALLCATLLAVGSGLPGVARPAAAAITSTTTASTLAGAIATSNTSAGVTITAQTLTTPGATAAGTGNSALAGFPTSGTTYGILTNGDATLADDGTTRWADTSWNARLGTTTAWDVTRLRLDLTVPTGRNCLLFDYRFLSEDYPSSLTNAGYNDSFVAELVAAGGASTWTTSSTQAVTAANNMAPDPNGQVVGLLTTGKVGGLMSAANGAGTAYTSAPPTNPGEGGATPLWTASKVVAAGNYTLHLSIFDQGPSADVTYSPGNDSAVFLDNLRAVTTGDAADCLAGRTSRLTLTNVVAGGSATPGDWILRATSAALVATDFTSGVARGLVPGAYTIGTVGGPTGYTPSAWSCTGATLGVGNTITLGDASTASCTITHTPTGPSLTLVKQVVGGPALASAWTLQATNGSSTISGVSGTSGTAVAGTTYTLSESGGPSYYAQNPAGWSCAGATVVGGNQVSITSGTQATCTIRNDYVRPTLQLVKVVNNDAGGTTGTAAWTLSASGPTPISGVGGTAATSVTTGTYALAAAPSSLAGYGTGTWSCTGGAQSGASVTVSDGSTVVCTHTSTYARPTLALTVTAPANTGGGAATAGSFTIGATGTTPLSGTGSVAAAGVIPGPYGLTIAGPSGYRYGPWLCTGGALAGSTVSVTDGSAVSCSITPIFIRPTLRLVKVVDNTGGGTRLASAWTLSATGPSTISGAGGTGPTEVSAGIYTLAETPTFSNYAALGWTCSRSDGSAVPVDASSRVTIAGAEDVTCSIVNRYIQPGLTLYKTVANAGGGTAVATDWTLVATSTANPATSFSGATGTLFAVAPGTYALSEIGGTADYSNGTWSCTGGAMPAVDQVTVLDGASVACTVVNSYRAPKLTLVKQTVRSGGGAAPATSWTLTAAGPVTIAGATGGATITNAIVPVGSYALSEAVASATLDREYEPGAWACTGSGTFSQSGSSVVLAVGAVVTCTIVNTYRAPANLTLATTVSGGSATAGDFTLGAAGPTPVSTTSGGSTQVRRGTYALSATGPAGYVAADWICTGAAVTGGNQVSISEGSTVSCSTVSTYQTGGGGGGGGGGIGGIVGGTATLTLAVRVQNAGGGTARASAWTMLATGPATVSGASGSAAVTNATAVTGLYLLRRPRGPSGYAQTGWTCTGGRMTDALHVDVTGGSSVRCETTMIFLRPYLATGTFVVVNKAARLGATVRYWGATWARDNGLAASPGLSVFRGFAASVSRRPAVVGGTWSGSVSASAAPPRTLPSLIAVVVANQVRKRGTTVSGNIIRIVLVQRSATFGRGKVVAVLAP